MIDANDKVVSVYGNESMGRYLEFKDVRTGSRHAAAKV